MTDDSPLPRTADMPKAPDVDDLAEQMPSQAAAVHAVIRHEGQRELEREFMALLWSAIAGGITMSSSFLARGLMQAKLHGSDYAFLFESAGYTLGFIFVIAAGQQLFTENTVTPVLPFMANPTWARLKRLLRLWGTVLLGNMIGALIAAGVFAWTPIFSPDVHAAFEDIGEHMLARSWGHMMAGGVISGWLVATMVWAIFAAPRAKLALIFLATYLMALGEFPHVVVGTVEVGFMVMEHHEQFLHAFFNFWLPTLVGNVVGGTFIFALISHAQVQADGGRLRAERRARR